LEKLPQTGQNIGLRVDASCRFLYDDLGKGA
jgi:hypothetical protein